MDDSTVAALVDRLVRDARVPGRRAREELRRELAAHFEDAGDSPESRRAALARFGDPGELAGQFRRVYRWDYFVFYLAKIASSVVLSIAVALVIQVAVNLRVELRAEALRLAPGFSRAAVLSVAVVLGLATAWEIARRPFDAWRASIALGAYGAICFGVRLAYAGGVAVFASAAMLVMVGCLCTRLERRPLPLLLAFSAFTAAIYAVHLAVSVGVGPAQAVAASAVLIAVWTSTIAIFSRFDHLFFDRFDTQS